MNNFWVIVKYFAYDANLYDSSMPEVELDGALFLRGTDMLYKVGQYPSQLGVSCQSGGKGGGGERCCKLLVYSK